MNGALKPYGLVARVVVPQWLSVEQTSYRPTPGSVCGDGSLYRIDISWPHSYGHEDLAWQYAQVYAEHGSYRSGVLHKRNLSPQMAAFVILEHATSPGPYRLDWYYDYEAETLIRRELGHREAPETRTLRDLLF
jgi:hypothetical protein